MSRRAVLITLGVAVVGYVVLWSTVLAIPFQWFTVLAHEISHGIMAELAGGDVVNMAIEATGGGLTQYTVPWAPGEGDTQKVLISAAGPLGSALVGAALLGASVRRDWTDRLLIGLGIVAIITTILWAPLRAPENGSPSGAFTWIFVAGMVALFYWLIRHADDVVQQTVVVVLGVATSLSAFDDLRRLINLRVGPNSHSDAFDAEQFTGVTDWFWALLWSMLAVGGLWIGLRQIMPGGLGLINRRTRTRRR